MLQVLAGNVHIFSMAYSKDFLKNAIDNNFVLTYKQIPIIFYIYSIAFGSHNN